MSTIDFSGYATAMSALERADALKSEGSISRATWIADNASAVDAALPPLGTMGAPKKGSDHAAMANAIRAMFPGLTADAQKHVVTRVFLLCRIAAAPRNARKEAETIEEYAARVDKWAAVANKEDGDKVRELIDGKKRGPKTPEPKDPSAEDVEEVEEGSKAKETNAANLAPVILAARRTMRQAFESGKIDRETWDKYLSDMAYETALDKAAREPIQASA